MKYCPRCNKKFENGKFCPECGEQLIDDSVCSKCGSKLDPGAKFCSECGTPVGLKNDAVTDSKSDELSLDSEPEEVSADDILNDEYAWVSDEFDYEIFKKAAEQGHIMAMYNLARKYCIDNDYEYPEEGKRLLKTAADAGYGPALVELGCRLVCGTCGFEQKPKIGIRYIRDGYTQNEEDSPYWLGYCKQYGLGCEKDLDEAIKYYKEEVEKGDVEDYFVEVSYYQLGLCFKEIENYTEAAEWFLRGVDSSYNNGNCSVELGKLYLLGNGVNEDYLKGIEYLKKSAKENNLEAADWLGYCYLFGEYGVKQDDRKAVYYLKKGAKGGYHDSKKYLGYCYGTGSGVEKNLSKSLELLNEVCNEEDNEDGESFYLRGLVYQVDDVDPKKAFNNFEKSAGLDNPYGMRELIRCYYNGYGTEKNRQAVKELLKTAQEYGWDFSGEDFSKSDGWETLKTVGKVSGAIALGGLALLGGILGSKNKK